MPLHEAPLTVAEQTIDHVLAPLRTRAGKARDDLLNLLAETYSAIYPVLQSDTEHAQWVEEFKRLDIRCGNKFCLAVVKYVFREERDASALSKRGKALQYLVDKQIEPERALEVLKDKTIEGLANAMAKKRKPQAHAAMRTKVSLDFEKFVRDIKCETEVKATLLARKNANGVLSLEMIAFSPSPSLDVIVAESPI